MQVSHLVAKDTGGTRIDPIELSLGSLQAGARTRTSDEETNWLDYSLDTFMCASTANWMRGLD